MRALNQRERAIAWATLATIMAAAAYVWFVVPQMARHDELCEEISQLHLSLAKMQSNMQLRDRIESQYEGVKVLLHESGSPSQEMSRFARLLSDLYSRLNMKTTSVRPLPDVQESYYRRFVLRLEVAGTVAEIAQFLRVLSEVSEPIRVEWLELVCKDRPSYVAASVIISKVVTTGQTGDRSTGQVAARDQLKRIHGEGE